MGKSQPSLEIVLRQMYGGQLVEDETRCKWSPLQLEVISNCIKELNLMVDEPFLRDVSYLEMRNGLTEVIEKLKGIRDNEQV